MFLLVVVVALQPAVCACAPLTVSNCQSEESKEFPAAATARRLSVVRLFLKDLDIGENRNRNNKQLARMVVPALTVIHLNSDRPVNEHYCV